MLRILTWLRNGVALVGLSWILITFTPLVRWLTEQLAHPWGNCQGSTLIVLSGNAFADDILGNSSFLRSVYTVREQRKHNFPLLLFSGGKAAQPGGKSTAELMRDFVHAHGIDTSHAIVETESNSTRENAIRSFPLLPNPTGNIVLLTSEFHMWRAIRVFRKAGIPAEPCPVPDAGKRYGSWELRVPVFVELVTEVAKIAWYRWQSWI